MNQSISQWQIEDLTSHRSFLLNNWPDKSNRRFVVLRQIVATSSIVVLVHWRFDCAIVSHCLNSPCVRQPHWCPLLSTHSQLLTLFMQCQQCLRCQYYSGTNGSKSYDREICETPRQYMTVDTMLNVSGNGGTPRQWMTVNTIVNFVEGACRKIVDSLSGGEAWWKNVW